MIQSVIKRNGIKEDFQQHKIKSAILKAMRQVEHLDEEKADEVTQLVTFKLEKRDYVPTVDEIHNLVEDELMNRGLNNVAKEYIL